MSEFEKSLIIIILNVIFIVIMFKIINMIDKKAIEKIRNEESDSPLLKFIPIIMKCLKAVLIFLACTGYLQSRGYSVSSILAGFGIGGLAVGMAAKEAIANIFGSIGILSDRVYKIGDFVKIDNIEGYVEDINIRSTKIRDLDNFLITVPNNVAANAVVTNVSKAKKRFLNETFSISYSTNDENIIKARTILEEIPRQHESEIPVPYIPTLLFSWNQLPVIQNQRRRIGNSAETGYSFERRFV